MKMYMEEFNNLQAVLSERADGSMRLFFNEPIGEQNDENRARFFAKCGIEPGKVVSARLINGTNVKIINDLSQARITNTDGLVTDKKGIFLSLTVADCIPIYFHDHQKEIVGLAHAGWRGIVGGIIENTISKMKSLGSDPRDISVQLGPGINECHFEIKEDILDQFKGYEKFIFRKNEKMFVDLKGIILKQLENAGIKVENIQNDPNCTFCSSKYFSFRRDKPPFTEAMIAIIGMPN